MGWFSNGNSTGNYVFHRKRPRRGYLQIVGCVPAKFPFHIYICIFIHTSAYTCIFYILFLSLSSSLPFMHVKTNELMVCENQYVYVFILSYISTCVYHRPNFKRYWGKFISISRLKILKFVQMLKVVCCVCSTVKYKNVITM